MAKNTRQAKNSEDYCVCVELYEYSEGKPSFSVSISDETPSEIPASFQNS